MYINLVSTADFTQLSFTIFDLLLFLMYSTVKDIYNNIYNKISISIAPLNASYVGSTGIRLTTAKL